MIGRDTTSRRPGDRAIVNSSTAITPLGPPDCKPENWPPRGCKPGRCYSKEAAVDFSLKRSRATDRLLLGDAIAKGAGVDPTLLDRALNLKKRDTNPNIQIER